MFASKVLTSWRKFVFGVDTSEFFKRFILIFYPYCLYEIWSVDWSFYHQLSPWLYHPVGLAELLHLSFPNKFQVRVVQVAASGFALLAMSRVRFKFAALAFSLLLLLLDAWPNMFGFINVRIHLVWFAALLSLCDLDRRKDPVGLRNMDANSLTFRCMELVLVLAYVQAGYAKLVQSGFAWASDGTTLQIGMLRQGMPAGVWISRFSGLMTGMSWLSIMMEFSFAFYFFVPTIRRPLLMISICFHLGTWLTMGISFSHLWIFSISVLTLLPTQLERFEVAANSEAEPQIAVFVKVGAGT